MLLSRGALNKSDEHKGPLSIHLQGPSGSCIRKGDGHAMTQPGIDHPATGFLLSARYLQNLVPRYIPR